MDVLVALLSRGTTPVVSSDAPKVPVELPHDIWECVLDYLDAKLWLRRLLVVSKHFYSMVLPRLYKSLHFIIGSEFDYRLVRLLSNDNRGLAHVKELILTSGDGFQETSEYTKVMASLFVEHLPRHVLQRFVWDSNNDIPENVLVSLWARQHLLTNIELVRGFDVEKEFVKKPHILKALKCLKSLRISPDRGSFGVAGSLVLESGCKIDTLILDHSSLGWMGQRLPPGDLEDGDPAQKLLRPFLPGRGAPITLRRLELTSVDLHSSPQTLGPALEFGTLKDLKIRHCARADLFISALSQTSSRTPQLETLHIKYEKSANPEPIVYAINDYLENSENSLVKLWICLRGCTAQPKVSGILRHGSTLKQLFVDVRDDEDQALEDSDYAHLYSLDDWFSLTQGLAKVAELAVPFAKIVANGQLLYVNDVIESDFETQLAHILRLPRLETLNITTNPYPCSTDRRLSLAAHTQLVTFLATQILTACSTWVPSYHPERLEVIAFGLREYGTQRQFHFSDPLVRPMYFSKVRQVFQGLFTDEASRIAMVKVRFRTLKVNNLAVGMLEEVLDEKVRDEVWETV